MTDFLKLSQEAFEASTAYVESNHRGDLEYSLRAFRNEHAAGSKYNTPEYASRSRLFRPKTRSIIRKNEAAGAVAFFSNTETASITPGNPDDPMSVASAACLKEILEYRLSRTIPAFPLVMGALQDAQTQGVVCSYQYWEYEKRGGKLIKDKPCIELRPIENIRLDGGASWLDPVGTSPYFCDIIPMYVNQVRGMMKNKDDKTGSPKWKKLDDNVILKARPDLMDGVRKARLGKAQDPHEENTEIKDFYIVWVMRWFMKDSQNDDHTFYTMGTEDLLTDPVPLEEAYFHNIRPYVLGYSILETHKVMKPPLPILVRPLQQETNDVGNMRLDNVKFVLHKRWFVARGRQVDVQSLVRGVPGGVTLVTDPKTDVQESNWPDVTGSSFEEQHRLDSDFDDLAGNFSPGTKLANKGANDTLGGNKMASQGAGLMTDYLLRTFIETWWEPVLRQLVLLEQYYETDEIVLGVCANKARLFPRFGLSSITDDLLMKEVNVSVNVGMGASNPAERFQKLMVGTGQMMQVAGASLQVAPNFNVKEFFKEGFSNMGYRDGARFLSDDTDPKLAAAMKMIQQLQGALQGKQMELQATSQVEMAKIQSNEKIKGAEIQVNAQRIAGDLRVRETENAIESARLDLERFIAQMEADGVGQEHVAKLQEFSLRLKEGQLRLEEQRIKNQGTALKLVADLRKKEAQAEAS